MESNNLIIISFGLPIHKCNYSKPLNMEDVRNMESHALIDQFFDDQGFSQVHYGNHQRLRTLCQDA